MKTVLLLALAVACASPKKEDPNLKGLLELQARHAPKHAACQEQIKNVLEKAVHEDEAAAKKNQDPYRFVKHEKEALALIHAFDLNKFVHEELKKEGEYAVNRCVDLEQVTFDKSCSSSFPVYHFFRGLTYGMKHYGWSRSTKALGKDLLKRYAYQVANSEASLLELIMVQHNLKHMLHEGLLSTRQGARFIRLGQEMEQSSHELRGEYERTFSDQKTKNCEALKKIWNKEVKLTKEYAARLKALLPKLN